MATHGLDWDDVKRGIRNDEVAAIAGVEYSSLEKSTFVSMGATGHIQGEVFSTRHWEPWRDRQCDACIAEDAKDVFLSANGRIRRTWWDFISIHKCPIHHCDLMPSKKRPQLLRNLPLNFTDAWESYFVGRLGFIDRSSSDLLDQLPLATATKIVGICGCANVYGFISGAPFKPMELLRQSRVVARGFETAQSERSFIKLLDKLWENADKGKRGWFTLSGYNSLGQQFNPSQGDEFAPLLKIITSHATENVPKYLRANKNVAEPLFYSVLERVRKDLTRLDEITFPVSNSIPAVGPKKIPIANDENEVTKEMLEAGVECVRRLLGPSRPFGVKCNEEHLVRKIMEIALSHRADR